MRKIKNIILLLSLIASIIVFVDNLDAAYSGLLLAMIPLSFGVLFRVLVPNNAVIGAGFCMLNIVCFLRYVVYPLLFRHDYVDNGLMIYYNGAVLLTIFEMIVIYVIINHSFRSNKDGVGIGVNLKMERISPVVPIILLLLSIGIYMAFPFVYANRHFITEAEGITVETLKIPGYVSMPLSWAQVILIVFFFSFFYTRYIRHKSSWAFYLSILVILYPCMFYSGHSRISLLMPLVCSIFMLRKIYRDKSKKVIFLIGMYGSAAILLLSWYKFGYAESSSASSDFTLEENAGTINAYFGGLKNMMIGLRAYSGYGHSISVFFNDILRNAMGISSYFEGNPANSVTIFNNSVYAGTNILAEDQICPTIIEGALSFGLPLCFIPTFIMVKTICWMDKKWLTTTSLEFSYLFAYVATLIGWCLPGNLMHLSTAFFNIFLPISLLIILNRKLLKIG